MSLFLFVVPPQSLSSVSGFSISLVDCLGFLCRDLSSSAKLLLFLLSVTALVGLAQVHPLSAAPGPGPTVNRGCHPGVELSPRVRPTSC